LILAAIWPFACFIHFSPPQFCFLRLLVFKQIALTSLLTACKEGDLIRLLQDSPACIQGIIQYIYLPPNQSCKTLILPYTLQPFNALVARG